MDASGPQIENPTPRPRAFTMSPGVLVNTRVAPTIIQRKTTNGRNSRTRVSDGTVGLDGFDREHVQGRALPRSPALTKILCAKMAVCSRTLAECRCRVAVARSRSPVSRCESSEVFVVRPVVSVVVFCVTGDHASRCARPAWTGPRSRRSGRPRSFSVSWASPPALAAAAVGAAGSRRSSS